MPGPCMLVAAGTIATGIVYVPSLSALMLAGAKLLVQGRSLQHRQPASRIAARGALSTLCGAALWLMCVPLTMDLLARVSRLSGDSPFFPTEYVPVTDLVGAASWGVLALLIAYAPFGLVALARKWRPSGSSPSLGAAEH
jgi:hypothetical protein